MGLFRWVVQRVDMQSIVALAGLFLHNRAGVRGILATKSSERATCPAGLWICCAGCTLSRQYAHAIVSPDFPRVWRTEERSAYLPHGHTERTYLETQKPPFGRARPISENTRWGKRCFAIFKEEERGEEND